MIMMCIGTESSWGVFEKAEEEQIVQPVLQVHEALLRDRHGGRYRFLRAWEGQKGFDYNYGQGKMPP